jgi:hypothetical protein
VRKSLAAFNGSIVAKIVTDLPQAVQKDRPARPQAEQEPEAYPLGYVEDSREERTPLADFFNSLLELVLRYAIPQRIASDLEEPACFGNIAACALQRFL